jgi:hypothetical protein
MSQKITLQILDITIAYKANPGPVFDQRNKGLGKKLPNPFCFLQKQADLANNDWLPRQQGQSLSA